MAPSRFKRDYELVIQVSDAQAVIVRPRLRVSFTATKTVPGIGGGGINKMTIRIYNLKPSNRLALTKDAEQGHIRIPLSFRVGYEDTLQLLFSGTVHRGQNFREGADMVTELECLDGGFDFLNSFTAQTVKGGRRAVDAILGDMPNTGTGKITDRPVLIRPKVLVGASAKLLGDLIDEDESWYIDDEKLYIIKVDEVVSSFIPVVRASTGLLNTPTREQSLVTFDTLLNPTLKIGALCQLLSTSAPHMDGVYKIFSMGFSGDTYGARWQQTVSGILAAGYTVL